MFSILFFYVVGLLGFILLSRFLLRVIIEPSVSSAKTIQKKVPEHIKKQVNKESTRIIYSEEDYLNFEKKVKILWGHEGELLKYREEDVWSYSDIVDAYSQKLKDEYNKLSKEEQNRTDFDDFVLDLNGDNYGYHHQHQEKFYETKKEELEKKARSNAKPLESNKEFLKFYQKAEKLDGFPKGEYVGGYNPYFDKYEIREDPTATELFNRMQKYMFSEKEKFLLKSLAYFYGRVYKWEADDGWGSRAGETEINENLFPRLFYGDSRLVTAFKKLKKSI